MARCAPTGRIRLPEHPKRAEDVDEITGGDHSLGSPRDTCYAHPLTKDPGDMSSAAEGVS